VVDSKTTDKLKLLTEVLGNMSESQINSILPTVRSISINWEHIGLVRDTEGDIISFGVVCPMVDIVFK